MSIRQITLAALCLASGMASTASAVEPVEAVRPPRRPILKLVHPRADESYSHHSSVAVTGRLSIPLHVSVEIRIFHLRDDGGLVQQGGTSVSLRTEDEFAATIYPPAAGWEAGRTIIEARLNQMRQVFARTEIVMSGPALKDRDAPAPRYDVPSSGRTFDLDRGPNVLVVPPEERFLVTGTFPRDPRFAGATQGPSCIGEVTMRRQDGKKLIYASALTIPLPHAGNRWWYEIEFKAPDKPGQYTVEIHSFGQPIGKPVTLIVGRSFAAR